MLRRQYVHLHAAQNARQRVHWSVLAESFLDMNNALEATLGAVTRPSQVEEALRHLTLNPGADSNTTREAVAVCLADRMRDERP
jgi:hypothetical protein